MCSLLTKREAKVKFAAQKQGRPTCQMQAFCKVMPTSIYSLIRLKRKKEKKPENSPAATCFGSSRVIHQIAKVTNKL
jgi:hypothetical protein